MIEVGVIAPTEPIDDKWLAPEFRKRLAEAGLVPAITGETLGEWLDRYVKVGDEGLEPPTSSV